MTTTAAAAHLHRLTGRSASLQPFQRGRSYLPVSTRDLHLVFRRLFSDGGAKLGPASSSSVASSPPRPTHLIFGANTDVGKTIVSAGLVRASLRSHRINAGGKGGADDDRSSGFVQYLKPLQCGGSDERFVARHALGTDDGELEREREQEREFFDYPELQCATLFEWDTAASPHVSSRLEDAPVSDAEVLLAVEDVLARAAEDGALSTFVETAGGVMSPSSASPMNAEGWHSSGSGSRGRNAEWGWSTQADLYSPLYSRLNLPTLLVGDGRLGGISVTLTALEALEARGYAVHGVALIDDGHCGVDNARALGEYAASARGRRQHRRRLVAGRSLAEAAGELGGGGDPEGVFLLPPIPAMPEPLDGWFASDEVEGVFSGLNKALNNRYRWCPQRQ